MFELRIVASRPRADTTDARNDNEPADRQEIGAFDIPGNIRAVGGVARSVFRYVVKMVVKPGIAG